MSNTRKDYKLYFLDIVSACRKILRYTKGIDHDEFAGNSMIIDAVIRNLEIIGEAVNKIPPVMRNDMPSIPWNEIVGLRNKVVHEYFDINVPIIWETTKTDIPLLLKHVEKALKELGSKQLKLSKSGEEFQQWLDTILEEDKKLIEKLAKR